MDAKDDGEPGGLRYQVAQLAGVMPGAWPLRLRQALAIIGMLIIGTALVCLGPVLMFALVGAGFRLAGHH